MIGKTLGQYEIRDLLGKGGMGEVYRAFDTRLGREVALKLLPAGFDRDPERLHRFEREARALAALSHRNIATIHGFEHEGGHRFLVLELVEGENLAQRLARGRIPARDALEIARQIAEGMEAAHDKGIIHRDLKPANIKAVRDGGVKVLDFGLARFDETLTPSADLTASPTITMDHTRDGTLLGTAPYMSPEQLKGQPVDARTDIWAFGCVLYEMLTGISPFLADSSPEIMARTLGEDPDWSKLPGDVPPAVVRLLRRCLAKDARHRLHSAADIRIVLQEALEGKTEPALETASPPRGSMLRTGLVAALAFALGGVAVWLFAPRPEPGPVAVGESSGPVRLMVPVRDGASVVPVPESPSVAISPDGRFVVYTASVADAGPVVDRPAFARTQLYIRPIDSFDSRAIPGTDGGSSPFFSPDGEWVGFFDFHDGMVRKVARDGGLPIDLSFVQTLTLRGAYWAGDGYVYFSDSAILYKVHENGGEAERVAGPDTEAGVKTYRAPDILPGGRHVLITRGTSEILSYDDADIALLDLQTGDVRVLLRGGLDPQYLPSGHVLFGRGGKAYVVPFDLERLEVTGAPVEALQGVVTSEGYGSLQVAVSPNGTLVYVAGGPEQFAANLMVLHADGQVENLPHAPRPYGSLQLSPDASRAAVSVLGANASIWIYDLVRGTMTKLVSGWDNFSPVWDTGGTSVAFATNRGTSNSISITSADGTGAPRVLATRISSFYPTSWSPDGKLLALSGISPTTGLDIWMLDSDGNTMASIQSAAREMWARFSPDGKYLAYTSDESGRIEIYVQALPVPGRKWKLSEDGGELPVWSRKNDRVYYWKGQRLMVVPYELDPSFRPSRARVALEADIEVHDYDVFPDDDRFLVIGRPSTSERAARSITRGSAEGRLFPARSPDLHIVLNWFEELVRLAPPK